MISMTSEDDKTVHQECINAAEVTICGGGMIVHGSQEAVSLLQGWHSELHRLHHVLDEQAAMHRAGTVEIELLREESRLFREAGKSAELRIVELRAKLARVEDWYNRTTTSDPEELCDAMNELGNVILRE
jgi:hypothetical protein